MSKHTCPEHLPCTACTRLIRRRERYATDSAYKEKLQTRARTQPRTEATIIHNRDYAREYSRARRYRLKDDPTFQAQQRERDKKRRQHTCPDVLPCKPCTINERARKKQPLPRGPRGTFPAYKKSSRLYWKMAVGLLSQRDGWMCHLCHETLSWETVTIDHLTPQCIDPMNHTAENLRLAHRVCNSRRGETLLQT